MPTQQGRALSLRSVRKQFLDRLQQSGAPLPALTPAAGVDHMIRFYAGERVAHCPPEEDGDLLVFQWGVYDWGRGERFELNVTRELMTAAGDGAEDVRQLGLTFRFPATPALRALGEGELCCDGPEQAEWFLAGVRKTKVYRAVMDAAPAAVELLFDVV